MRSWPLLGLSLIHIYLFDPPVVHAVRSSDAEILAYVRRGNYFDDQGRIALADTLGALRCV